MKFRMATEEEKKYYEQYLEDAMLQDWNWRERPAINLLGKIEPPTWLKEPIENEEVTYLPPKYITLKHHLLQFNPKNELYDCICHENIVIDYRKRPKQ